MVAAHPLRLGALALSFSFGLIAMAVGISALHKSNNDKDFVRENAPAGVRVDINTNDVLHSGIVVTVASGLLALTSLITLVLLFLSRAKPSCLRISAALHAFFTVWIFATLIPFVVFARNRSAKVAAFLGERQLPDSLVQQQQEQLGVSPVYWDQQYLRVLAILPWFAILFGTITAAVLFRTASTVRDSAQPRERMLGDKETDEMREAA